MLEKAQAKSVDKMKSYFSRMPLQSAICAYVRLGIWILDTCKNISVPKAYVQNFSVVQERVLWVRLLL